MLKHYRSLSALLIVCLFFWSPLLLATESPLEKQLNTASEKEKNGDYEGAQSLYEGILTYHPDHKEALLGLARVEYWEGKYKESIAAYEKFLKIYPGDAGGYVGIGKSYLALGDQKKAQDYFNKAQKIEPHQQEIEAMEPALEAKAAVELEGGVVVKDFTYQPDGQIEYQEFRYQKEKHYGGGIYSGYADQYGEQAFNTGLFGDYYFTPGTRIDAALYFAPTAKSLPHFSPSAKFQQDIGEHWTPGIGYQFQKFADADFHSVTPQIQFHPWSFLTIEGDYELQIAKIATGNKTLHSFSGNLELTPTEWFSVFAGYGRLARTFEAGRNPEINRTDADLIHGGLKGIVMNSLLLRFDFVWEKRNNAESIYSYLLGAGYRF